jgi:hypothetical protein
VDGEANEEDTKGFKNQADPDQLKTEPEQQSLEQPVDGTDVEKPSEEQGTAEEEEKPRETGNDQTTDGDTLDPQSIVEGDRTEGGHQAEDS